MLGLVDWLFIVSSQPINNHYSQLGFTRILEVIDMYTADVIAKIATCWFEVKMLLRESPESRAHLAAHIQAHSNEFLMNWFMLETAKKTFPGLTDFLINFVIQHKEKFLSDWFMISMANREFPELTDFLIDFVSQNKDQFLANEDNRKQAIRILPTGVKKLGLDNPPEPSPKKETSTRPLGFFEESSVSKSQTRYAGGNHGEVKALYYRYSESEIDFAARRSSCNSAKVYLNTAIRELLSDYDKYQLVSNLISEGYLTYREPGYKPEKPQSLSSEILFAMAEDEFIASLDTGDIDALDANHRSVSKP
jgi:hypothetical protein